jgi:hypothetical protein
MASPWRVREGLFVLENDSQPTLAGDIRNVGDEWHRRLMFLQEIASCSWKAELISTHYSTFHGDPAALIIVECSFSLPENIRFTSATINMSFDRKTNTNDRNPRDIPEVVEVFPSDVYGQITEVKHQVKNSIALGVSTPSTPAGSMNVQIGREHEQEFATGPRQEIHGSRHTNQKASRPLNVARWVVTENKGEKGGISRRFLFAAIVKYGGKRFFADVRIKVKAESKGVTINPVSAFAPLVISAWPWPKNDPVKFNPNDVARDLGLQDLKKPLDELTEDDYRNLAPLQDEYKVRKLIS